MENRKLPTAEYVSDLSLRAEAKAKGNIEIHSIGNVTCWLSSVLRSKEAGKKVSEQLFNDEKLFNYIDGLEVFLANGNIQPIKNLLYPKKENKDDKDRGNKNLV